MLESTSEFKNRLPANAIVKILSFLSMLAVGILYVPFLVKKLGVSAYGVVPLASTLTQYIGIISNCISQSVNRFLTIELQKSNGNPLATFNTSLAFFTLIGLIQLPIFSLAIINIRKLFSIPEEIFNDAIWLFVCSAIGYLFVVIGGVFNVSTFSQNRLDISEGINIFRTISRVLLTVVCFSVFEPSLRYIALVDLSVIIIVFFTKIYYWRKLTPNLHISFFQINPKLIYPILKMSGWVLINYLGSILYLRTDIWIINRFISSEASGQYAALLQWNTLIYTAGSTLALLSSPIIMIYFSRGEMTQLRKLANFTIKLLTSLLAIPVGLIAAFSPQILQIWIGKEFVPLWPVLSIMVSHLFLNAGITPVFQIQLATNKVKMPALVTLVLGFINTLLSFLIVVVFDKGLIGIVISGAIVLSLKNAIFSPWYAARITNSPGSTFFKSLSGGMFLAVFVYALGSFSSHFFNVKSTLHFFVAVSIISFISLVFFYFIILTKRDRQNLLSIVPANFRFSFLYK